MNNLGKVIIIGGGVVGTATAYHLKRLSPSKEIILLEQHNRVGSGNTSKSAALYRNLFSSSTSQALAGSSIAFYQTIADQISLNPIGYLWLFSKRQWEDSKQKISHLSQSNDVETMSRSRLDKLLQLNLPANSPFEATYAALYGHTCGSLSARKLTEYYAQKFEEADGTIRTNTTITNIELSKKHVNYAPWANPQIKTISDDTGNEYKATSYIFATGAWTFKILSFLGIYTGVLPKRRQLFGVRIKNTSQLLKKWDPEKVPIIILPTANVYIKPVLKRSLLVIGCASEFGEPFITQAIKKEPTASKEYFHHAIEPVIQHYFPQLDFSLELAWSGYYSYSADKNPIIDKKRNIIWSSGTSGSGIDRKSVV